MSHGLSPARHAGRCCLLTSCCDGGHDGGGSDERERLAQSSGEGRLSFVFYKEAILACAKAGQCDAALSLLNQMLEPGQKAVSMHHTCTTTFT